MAGRFAWMKPEREVDVKELVLVQYHEAGSATQGGGVAEATPEERTVRIATPFTPFCCFWKFFKN